MSRSFKQAELEDEDDERPFEILNMVQDEGVDENDVVPVDVQSVSKVGRHDAEIGSPRKIESGERSPSSDETYERKLVQAADCQIQSRGTEREENPPQSRLRLGSQRKPVERYGDWTTVLWKTQYLMKPQWLLRNIKNGRRH